MSDAARESDRGHREIDHTADLAFEAWGSDLAALFAEATEAVCEFTYDRSRVHACEQRSVSVRGDGVEEQLVRWLLEVYLLAEQEAWLTARVVDVNVGAAAVEGRLAGEPIDRQRHVLHSEVKAITYHGMNVLRDANGIWRTRVIVDV